MGLEILGMGSELPTFELSNKFLHEQVGLERGPDWVDSRLGIQTRYSVLSPEYLVRTKNKNTAHAVAHARSNNQTPVTLGVGAAKKALASAGVRADQIGWVIASNDTPYETVPNTATLIAQRLGIGTGPHCDVNCACSSFARHMQLLADSKEERLPEFILCVQTSTYTIVTDYTAKSIDGYILGDGAAAQVCSTRHQGRLKVEPLIYETQPASADDITLDSLDHFRQDGAAVREFSIRKTCEMYESIAAQKGLYAEKVYTVAHQANYVMQDSILGHLNLPQDRHLRNVQSQGNIAAAGCPSVISQSLEKFHKGDQLVYAVLGAGLAWGGGYMEAR